MHNGLYRLSRKDGWQSEKLTMESVSAWLTLQTFQQPTPPHPVSASCQDSASTGRYPMLRGKQLKDGTERDGMERDGRLGEEGGRESSYGANCVVT